MRPSPLVPYTALMINILTWDESLRTGFEEVDLQHKKLIRIIDDVHEAMQSPSADYALQMSKNLKKLTDYTLYHFSEEETFMKQHGYPDFAAHKLAHDAFIERLNGQIGALPQSGPDDGYRFYRYLGNWLLSHIAKADQAWAAYIREQSPAAP